MFIGVGVLCRFSYSVVSRLYLSFSGFISSVGRRERELFFLISITCYYVVSVQRGGAWDRLCYFIVTLPGPSVKLFYICRLS